VEKSKQLYDAFLKDIENLIKENQGDGGSRKDRQYIEKRMRLNVVEIFQRMFVMFYNNIFVELKNKEFEKYIEDYPSKEQGLKQAFRDIYDKITAPWVEKSKKDKTFGREEEYQKELLKLDTADKIRALFDDQYKNIYGEI